MLSVVLKIEATGSYSAQCTRDISILAEPALISMDRLQTTSIRKQRMHYDPGKLRALSWIKMTCAESVIHSSFGTPHY